MLEKDLFPLSKDMHKKVQPINTFKFKDDRRSVTTEEIWVNRMARKQNEALLSSDPRGVTWWQLYTRRPLNTGSSEWE